MREGFHPEIPEDEYHADPCEEPSLSASLAHTLVSKSPLHAWSEHPKLGNQRRESSRAMDEGTVLHALLLKGENVMGVVQADDWRTKAAKEERDKIASRGRIPVLESQAARLFEAAGIIRERLAERSVRFVPEQAEITAVWHDPEFGVLCRARFDHLPESQFIEDLKTGADANPATFARKALNMGYDIQMAAYLEAAEALGAGERMWRWVLCETSAPYAVTIARPSEAMLDCGRRRWADAKKRWRYCLSKNEWPGYGNEIIEAPVWAMRSVLGLDMGGD